MPVVKDTQAVGARLARVHEEVVERVQVQLHAAAKVELQRGEVVA